MDPIDRGSTDAFVFAHQRYAIIRDTALIVTMSRAEATAPLPGNVAFTPLTPRAVHAFQLQWRGRHWTGNGGWPWTLLAHRFTRKPRSFHAALWSGPRLCGLCVGRVSKGRKHLTLHFMESAPDRNHPLRGFVTPLMFEAARNYGAALGVEKLLLRDPLPGLMPRYARFGFTLVGNTRGPVYLERDVA
jgi:hypothetical protein